MISRKALIYFLVVAYSFAAGASVVSIFLGDKLENLEARLKMIEFQMDERVTHNEYPNEDN